MYGRMSDPGMGPYPPGVRWLYVRPTANQRSAIGHWGSGFHTVRGGFDPGSHRFRRPVVIVVKV